MIEALGLTKRYGERVAVDRLSFTVRPGQVTGFLGPNGAGKGFAVFSGWTVLLLAVAALLFKTRDA
jgi:ABC-type Na+ transport system ATPase subunit NatA